MFKQAKRLLQFGEFQLDCDQGLLYRTGALVPLTPKVFQTLLAFVERPGELITKEELMQAVWPDTFVDESNLASNVHILRRTLNSNGGEHFIETLPKRGYRFIAPVEQVTIQPPVEKVETPAPPDPAASGATTGARSSRVGWLLLIAIAAIGAGGMQLALRTTTPEPALVRLTAHAGSNTQPDVSPDGRHVVFVSNRDGGAGQIYIMDADGSHPRNLTGNPKIHDDSPAWSPDGHKIAFQSDRHSASEIFTMDADGGHPTLIAPGARAAWSPDGKMLACARSIEGHSEIWVFPSDGSSPPRRLTFDRHFCADPTWSPDGTRIAFTSAGVQGLEIQSTRVDGTDRVVLAAGHCANRLPVWFRDGRIAFNSNRDGHDALFVMESDGTLQHRITDASADEDEAAWSPDGRSLVFESDRSGNSDIYRMRLPDAPDGAIALTSGLANNVHPSWSPDGKWIAFESSRDGTPNIFAMDAEGRQVRNLTRGAAASHRPVWSWEGTRIAFTGERDGKSAIYMMNADGSDPHRVSEGPADDNPAWSPDGRQICFDRAGDVWVVASAGGGSRRLAEGLECSWDAGGRILFARPQGNVREIYRMNADGSGESGGGLRLDGAGIANVTNNARGNGTPMISRDGSRIVFNSNRDRFGFGIFVMNADGSAQTRITARRVFDMQPSWSPDGRWVVFARDRNRSWEIFKIAVP